MNYWRKNIARWIIETTFFFPLFFELLTLTCSLSQSEPPLELKCREEYVQLRSSWLCCCRKASSRGQQRQRIEEGSGQAEETEVNAKTRQEALNGFLLTICQIVFELTFNWLKLVELHFKPSGIILYPSGCW